MSDDKNIWNGPTGLSIPNSAKEPVQIVPFATSLTEKQQKQIISAFQLEAYDMAADYAWKKGMGKLKETLATLGMKFIGEMLDRPDITEHSNIENVLTDYSTIQLAEQLGVIGRTGSLKLRQANELIAHYFSKDADEEISYTDAFIIVRAAVQYILGEQDISIAVEFSKFRERILSENFPSDDPQLLQVISSPLFYLRTVLAILLSAIKNETGARLEHALANLNLVIEDIWQSIAENDKWNIGTAYRDVTAAGNMIAASGVKSALLKVNGFDYVPENLRSMTFKATAKELLDVHFGWNNFHNEPSVVRKLASLGTTIPSPALVECMQAYLAVFLGNSYGISRAAAPVAEKELAKISEERWRYYFQKILKNDEKTLEKLIGSTNKVDRFSNFLKENSLDTFEALGKSVNDLYSAILKKSYKNVNYFSTDLLNTIKGK